MTHGIGAMEARAAPLPFRHKLGYASGQVLDTVVQQSLGIFLLFYVTSVCGLPGALAGFALAAGLVVDAVLDPIIGSVSDGWRSRMGRRLPFMALALPLVTTLFVLIFSLPQGLETTALFLWLTLLSIGLRVSLSLFILPYQAVGAEISEDHDERSSIMTWRWGIGMIGAVAAVLLGFGVFFAGTNGLSDRSAYTPFALSLALLVVLCSLVAMRVVRVTLPRQHAPAAAGAGLHARLFSELGEVLRNRSFRILFVGAVLFFTALGTHMALGLHANSYFWHLTPDQIQSVTLAVFVGMVMGAPLAGPMLKRMEKRSVLLIGIAGMGLSHAGPAAFRLLGLLPLEGAPLAVLLSAIVFSGGVLMAAAAIAFSAMMADAADEHEYLFDARREGLYFAGWSFASKAATGLGALLAGLILQLAALPAATDPANFAAVPDHSARLLALFYGPGAGLLYAAAVFVIARYTLDSKRHAAILGVLNERRAHPDRRDGASVA